MKAIKFLIIIFAVLLFQSGCGDSVEEALTEQNISDAEILTKQKLYETADEETRWRKSRAARKRYIRLRETYPDVALKAYIEYRNWLHHGHPLATEVATMSAKMDMAGKTNLLNMLKFLNLELEMITDLEGEQEHIDEIKESINFWTELKEELISENQDPADFEIQYSISEKTLN